MQNCIIISPPTKIHLMSFYKFSISLVSFLFYNITTYGATCTALASSNWSLSSTWSCGSTPGCNDIIVIPAGYTVTINNTIDLTGNSCSGTKINIYGVLFFSGNASKLDMVATATINIFSGGGITTDQLGNNSQKITIGNGSSEWSSNNGNLSGPWSVTNGNSGTNSSLPIELVSFNGYSVNNNSINLNWKTSSEKNNNYFELERSDDGYIFYPIEIINSKSLNGFSIQPLNYETIDYYPVNGINYYRLKQVDFSEEYIYSKIIPVLLNKEKNTSFILFPNPNNGEFNVTRFIHNQNIDIFVYNSNQSLVYNAKASLGDIDHEFLHFDFKNILKPGLYQVLFLADKISYNCPLIIQ